MNLANNKWFLLLLGALVVAILTLYFVGRARATQCNINNPENCPVPSPICDNGEHTGNPHCITPTPTIHLTPTLSPTPTAKPCKEDCDISPTPTVEPSVTPTPTEEKHEVGQPGNPLTDPNSCTVKDCNTHPVTPTPNYPTCDVPNTCGWK